MIAATPTGKNRTMASAANRDCNPIQMGLARPTKPANRDANRISALTASSNYVPPQSSGQTSSG